MICTLVYDFIFLIPLTATVAIYVRPYAGGETSIYLSCAAALSAAAFLLLMKRMKLKGRAVLSGMLLTLLLALWMLIPSGERQQALLSHIWILREGLAGAVCFIAAVVWERHRFIRNALAAAGCLILAVSLRHGGSIKAAVIMTLLFATLCIADEVQRASVKEGDTDPKRHMAGIAPFILGVFMITAFIRVPDKPYDWGFVKKASQMIRSGYIYICEAFVRESGWDSDSGVIGFSDRTDLGGDIEGRERTVMEITILPANDPVIYLAGKTCDSFDGHSWSKTDESAENGRLLDTIETVGAVMAYEDSIPERDLIRQSNITIRHKDMHTSSMFIPAKCLLVREDPEDYEIRGEDLSSQKRIRTGKPYGMSFYRINRDSDVFDEFIRSPHPMDSKLWEAAAKKCGMEDDAGFSEHQRYCEHINELYGKDTELSPEVAEYMETVLAGADTDYEKLCRLEDMFREFEYTEKPGELPDTVTDESSFLDYFLLESREGYCSYYATSFVLLARYCGIPARYVQGFRVPLSGGKEVPVSSLRAHAWAEAYIDGAGWFIFEPTPGYNSAVSISWDTGVKQEGYSYPGKAAAEEDASSGEEDEDVLGTQDLSGLRWYQILIPVLGGGLLTLVLFAADRLVRDRRYRKMNEREKAEYACRRAMAYLKRKRLGINPGETLEEYALRLGSIIPPEKLSFISLYEELLYSDREVSQGERTELENDVLDLMRSRFRIPPSGTVSYGESAMGGHSASA